jgi:hypothetical protein
MIPPGAERSGPAGHDRPNRDRTEQFRAASEQADFITGQRIVVDGGRSLGN